MITELFFEKFEKFADAPNAVEKMRGLIHSLAVQGRLSKSCAQDETVESLLEKNDEARNETATTDRRAKAEQLPQSSTELKWPVPTRWGWRALGDLMLFVDYRGKTPVKTKTGVRLITAKNIRSGYISLVPEEFIAESEYDSWMSRGLPRIGDVLFTTEAPLGNAAVVEIMDRFALAQRAICFQSYGALTGRFIAIQIASTEHQEILRSNATGMTAKGIKSSKLRHLPFAVPPLAEQKRIVANVDKLMALCDELEAQQRERDTQHSVLTRAALARFASEPNPSTLNLIFHKSYDIPPVDLRKTILTLAVQGKLVPFDADIKEGTVGDHIEFQNGYAFKSEWFKPSGMRLCRNANISHGVLDWRESAFVDDKVAKEFERFALNEGDIVLSLDRPIITTGLKVARVRKSDLPCLLLQRVAKPVQKHDQLDLSYFLLWLNSPEFVDSINPGRSNGVPHISTRQVQRLQFVLPPLDEQRRIVARVDELMSMVDQMETQLTQSRTTAQNLLQAVVGELTDHAQS